MDNANNGQVVEVGAILGLVTQNGEVKKIEEEQETANCKLSAAESFLNTI